MSNAARAMAAIIKEHVESQCYELRLEPVDDVWGGTILEWPLGLVFSRKRTPDDIRQDKSGFLCRITDRQQLSLFLGSPLPLSTLTVLTGLGAILQHLNDWLNGQKCKVELFIDLDRLAARGNFLASIKVSLRLQLSQPEQTLDLAPLPLGQLFPAETLEEIEEQYRELCR